MAEKDDLAETLRGIADHYGASLSRFGVADSRSVGWKDEQSQILRFRKLCELIEPASVVPGFSVNDWGCGYGAMFRHIDAAFPGRLRAYHGYDLSAEMLEAARGHVADPRAEWIQSAELARAADYSFVSGTFNVRLETDDAAWAAYIRRVLLELARASRRGFAFNVLTTYVDWKAPQLFYADPAEFFRFCKERISKYVSLLHDYKLFEWTILVRKEDAVP